MQEFIIDIMNRFGYFGIALLIAVENIFPPIPSEVILTFGGFMTTYSNMNVWLVILCATIGSMTGAVVLYLLGMLLSVERLERLFDGKFGKIMRLKKSDVRKAQKWFDGHGKKTVFFCRFIPIVRSLISIPAGMSKMSFLVFLPLTALGSVIWNTVLVFLGRLTGGAWEKVAGYFDTYSTIALVVILAAVAVVAVIFIKKRFINKTADGEESQEESKAENKEENKEENIDKSLEEKTEN